MKIYLLRHEERTKDTSFFSPLTETGIKNSLNLIKLLKSLQINIIYSSPFVRTLETIKPFVLKNKLMVKIEYGLMEIKTKNNTLPKSHNIELPKYMAKKFHYDEKYKSLIDTNNIEYPENIHNFYLRINKILKYLIKQYYETDKNILLVTHRGICAKISNINDYPMGGLSLIFEDKKFIFKKINF
jgi:broad specificity phosphatase PhoE